MPYVQFEWVGDFIPEPRCSKFVVGLQTEERKIGVQEVRSDSGLKGRERRKPRYVLSVRACAWYNLRVSKVIEGESIQVN